ncbi:MAG: hypothetical protein EPN89_15525 [Methylovulum sp.]|nr:MAG: hypothetical protein EPN89_15525 [Methylovulum sp.]
MNYADAVVQDLPIGSVVTEDACKTLVKQRLCCSGMRWKPQVPEGIKSKSDFIFAGIDPI